MQTSLVSVPFEVFMHGTYRTESCTNGQRYYLDVMQNYEKALKLNPENQLAKQLQQKFLRV